MDNYIEKTGKTVEEATALALEELGVEKDMVEIEIVEEGNKGILGLIGNKQAKVRVKLKEYDLQNIACSFLHEVLVSMGLTADISSREDEDAIYIQVHGMDSGIIIGRRGETLDALQYLVSLVVNKDLPEYRRVVLDVENYREKRKEALVRLANKLADKVRTSRKSVTLEPMNPYERRIIHSTLQENKFVRTYSVGNEPNRKVVINIKQGSY